MKKNIIIICLTLLIIGVFAQSIYRSYQANKLSGEIKSKISSVKSNHRNVLKAFSEYAEKIKYVRDHQSLINLTLSFNKGQAESETEWCNELYSWGFGAWDYETEAWAEENVPGGSGAVRKVAVNVFIASGCSL